MHSSLAFVTLVASLAPLILARSIPVNTRYGPASPRLHKSDFQERPTTEAYIHLHAITPASPAVAELLSDLSATPDNCMRTQDPSSLFEPNLQTSFFVKSLGMEELQQMLGVYMTNSPSTRTCVYPKPWCSTDDVYGFLCIPPPVSAGTLPASEDEPCQSELPAACGMNLGRFAKRGKPSTSRTYSPNETACGRMSDSAKVFECVGTETHPDYCGGCTVFSAVKGRYGSRLAGTDCAAISHADAVFRISDGSMVQSCLGAWSVDDDAMGCFKDQILDAPLSTGQILRATRLHDARRVLVSGFEQNTTGADIGRIKSHAPAGSSDTHLWGKRDVLSSDKPDRVTAVGAGHIKEDWTRIPDYRRHLV